MGKQVIVAKSKIGAWNTLEEASNALGMSVSTLSRRLRDVDPDFRYASRVYAIRMKNTKEWTVAVLDNSGRRYVTLGQSLRKIQKKEVDQVKDITACWYFNSGTELAGRDGSKRSEL